MADLEQRVATLERDMTALKERVGTHEEDTKNIPDLIKLEFRLASSQTARVSHDVAELQRNMKEVQSDIRELRGTVEALPRVIADLIAEPKNKR